MRIPGEVLDMPDLGVRVEVRESSEELIEFDVIGRARGLIAAEHIHTQATERYEVIEGTMRLVIAGREHRLGPGDTMETPPGTPHRQLPGPLGEGRVRVTVSPAGSTHDFLRRLASLRMPWGFPKPVDAAAIVRDFGYDGHASKPPIGVQRALSRALLAVASREYLFVDEWDVAAPPEAVFHAISEARTYPQWWTPVYIDVEATGEPKVGKESNQHFKGRLPYHLHTRSRITRLEPPHSIEADVDGDLRGHGKWTLTATATGTHVRFDWQVFADKPLLRMLTPILRPAFRWNHAWAIARAREGLEPYARAWSKRHRAVPV
ncbi:MAG TPA: SRPBCC family protein [Solirubrobacteraceae bacterium]